MTFKEKLDFLLRSFNVSNSKLARAINVDPSLVCKWRRGTRSLSAGSIYVPLIAEYILSIEATSNQKNIVINTLKQFNADIEMCSRLQLKKYLVDWISGVGEVPENAGIQEYVDNKNEFSAVNNILFKLNNPDTANKFPVPSCNAKKGKVTIKHGEAGSYEVFKGKQGKRQAVMNVLCMMLSMETPLELHICDEDSMDWIFEDKKFYLDFRDKLYKLISMGRKIVIIHNVNRIPAQIMAIIDFWIPLYLTGYVESYYSPKYSGGFHRKSIFTAGDRVAIMAVNPYDFDEEDSHLFMSKDPFMAQYAGNLFMSFLKKCHPLIKVFNSDNIYSSSSELYDMDGKPGDFYTLRNRFTALTIPVHIYSKLLDELPLSQLEKKERLDIHIRRIESFKKNIPYYKYIEIINIDSFDKIDPDEILKYDGMDFFVAQSVKSKAAYYKEHLLNIIQFLKEYEGYNVILVRLNEIVKFNRVSLAAKMDSTALLASCDSNGGNPVIMTAKQNNIVDGIGYYLVNMIDYIPETKRNKEAVIKKLTEYIAILEKWMTNAAPILIEALSES